MLLVFIREVDKMADKIRVAILEDHQSVVDGYLYRLGQTPDVEVVATAAVGEELEPMLADHPADVLILDVGVRTARHNPNPYPILQTIPEILDDYPELAILVISMYNQPTLIKSVMDAGASGYILKDDRATIQELGDIVRMVARGDIHLSQQAYQQLFKRYPQDSVLTPRQAQALSLCAAYPGETSVELAKKMGVKSSTLRNLLSGAYKRLEVDNRTAALAKARQLGLITPDGPTTLN